MITMSDEEQMEEILRFIHWVFAHDANIGHRFRWVNNKEQDDYDGREMDT